MHVFLALMVAYLLPRKSHLFRLPSLLTWFEGLNSLSFVGMEPVNYICVVDRWTYTAVSSGTKKSTTAAAFATTEHGGEGGNGTSEDTWSQEKTQDTEGETQVPATAVPQARLWENRKRTSSGRHRERRGEATAVSQPRGLLSLQMHRACFSRVFMQSFQEFFIQKKLQLQNT